MTQGDKRNGEQKVGSGDNRGQGRLLGRMRAKQRLAGLGLGGRKKKQHAPKCGHESQAAGGTTLGKGREKLEADRAFFALLRSLGFTLGIWEALEEM